MSVYYKIYENSPSAGIRFDLIFKMNLVRLYYLKYFSNATSNTVLKYIQ